VSLTLVGVTQICTLRRKAREQKAYSKQVQAEKEKERTQEKKRQIAQVSQLRKQREKSVSQQGKRDVHACVPDM
jgi:hypothetical protein